MEKSSNNKWRFISGGIFFGIAAFVLFTFVTMWLWNWLMPVIFSLGVITFWQSAGLLILAKILFSSGHAYRWHSDRKHKYWHSHFEEKWRHIPREKRHRFAQKMEEKGFGKQSAEDVD